MLSPLVKGVGTLGTLGTSNVYWCPDTGRIYQLAGKQAKIEKPGKNQTRYLLGSVQYPTGEGLYEIYPKKRNEEVEQHLTHLIEMCDRDFCFVVWDNASQHTTKMLLPFLWDNSERLMTVNLPTYSPHLNLIERLWRYMRDNITRNVFYQTFTDLCETLVGWLKRLPFSRFRSLMGIKSRASPLAA